MFLKSLTNNFILILQANGHNDFFLEYNTQVVYSLLLKNTLIEV